MSFPSRAPKGIPSGGQFVASGRSEPSVSLGKPNARRSMPLASAFVEGWDRKEAAPDDGFTQQNYADSINEARASRWAVQDDRGNPSPEPVNDPAPGPIGRVRDAAGRIGDRVYDTMDAVAELAEHQGDVRRGEAPAPEAEGSFVSWGQMVPKFLRREKPAQVTEPEPESRLDRSRRLGWEAAQMDSAFDRTTTKDRFKVW